MLAAALAAAALTLLAPLLLAAQQPPPQGAGAAGSGWVGIVGAPSGGVFPIVNLEPGSPALSAGVRVGDTLVAVNGVSVADSLPLNRLRPGDALTLELRRDGRNRTITVYAIDRSARRPDEITQPAAVPDPDNISRAVVRSVGDPGPAPGAAIRAGVTTGPASGDSLRGHGIPVPRDTTPMRPVARDTLVGFGAGRVSPGDTSGVFITQRRTVVRDTVFARDTAVARDTMRAVTQPRAAARDTAAAPRSGDIGRATQPGRRPAAIPEQGGTTFIFSGSPRALAGAQLEELDPDLAAYFRGASEGVLVIRVARDTPAARSGLRAGDVILQVGDRRVRNPIELNSLLSGEDGVALTVVRQGQRIVIRTQR